MADAELTLALKQAKSKKMFFAFVPKGSDGKLIVSKIKIPPKRIAETKKEIGGSNAVTGKCFGNGGSMVFQVAKAAPATLAAAIKKTAKRDAGITIDADVQLAGDADADEQDTGAAAASAASAAPPAAPGQANVLGIQKALQKLGYDPGKMDGTRGPSTEAAIKKFQQANGLAADGIMGSKTQAALAKALQSALTAGGKPAQPTPAPGQAAPASPGGGAGPAPSNLKHLPMPAVTVKPGSELVAGSAMQPDSAEGDDDYEPHMPQTDDSTLKRLPEELSKLYNLAFLNYEGLLGKRQELKDTERAIPDEDVIFNREIPNNTTPDLSGKANDVRGKKVDLKAINLQIQAMLPVMATFTAQEEAAIAKIDAEELLKEADELHKKANELKEERKRFNDLLEDALGLASMVAAPEKELFALPGQLELLAKAFKLTNDAAEGFHKGVYASIAELERQADEDRKKAHEKRLEALKKEADALEKARQELDKVATNALAVMDEAIAVAKSARTNFEDDYDRKSKGKFKFAQFDKALRIAGDISDTLAPQVQQSVGDAYGAIQKHVKSHPADLNNMKKDGWAWYREAGVIRKWAQERRKDLTDLYSTIIAAMATAHDRPSAQ